jgi:hypothetical protein
MDLTKVIPNMRFGIDDYQCLLLTCKKVEKLLLGIFVSIDLCKVAFYRYEFTYTPDLLEQNGGLVLGEFSPLLSPK